MSNFGKISINRLPKKDAADLVPGLQPLEGRAGRPAPREVPALLEVVALGGEEALAPAGRERDPEVLSQRRRNLFFRRLSDILFSGVFESPDFLFEHFDA